MNFIKLILISSFFVLTGCASSSSAPNFPDSWHPLNELPEKTTLIPLAKQHVYQVLQLDTTVKGLLSRWADEAKIPLVYDDAYDYTLYRPVKVIQEANLENALGRLSEFYEEQGMIFYVKDNVIMAHKKSGFTEGINKNKKRKLFNN